MDAIKEFCRASGAAVERILAAMHPEDRARAEALFAAGNSFSLAHEVHPDGTATVLFECIMPDGRRRVLAHVNAQIPTVQ